MAEIGLRAGRTRRVKPEAVLGPPAVHQLTRQAALAVSFANTIFTRIYINNRRIIVHLNGEIMFQAGEARNRVSSKANL